MLNYGNLNDVEFEYLCQDIMQEKLGIEIHHFAVGCDGGIDLCDNVHTKNVIVQVKHYYNSTVAQLISSLKNELKKVKLLNPKHYYVCCSKSLTPKRIEEIYNLFSDFMDSPSNVITLDDIDGFLTNEKNINVLKKHYKLWIESTGILQNIINSETFIDCEVLLSSIENDKKFFVETQAFYKALHYLENNKTLFIVGNPGVGKTITSKMLVLYYAAIKYKVRYTTNTTDLQSLKKSISQNPKEKEIILIDDCFGQAYFQMKDSQNEELLSLIKYINLSTNKRLILNSRVTIYQEARERNLELVKSFDNDECKAYIIDMNNISDIEKAKIFYNHLVFNNVQKEYFDDIKKDKRYLKIIKHKNYNPRIIEFICNPRHYENIKSNSYYNFILNHLNNPKEIWKDEYERRLQKTDRILLSTIYSFSDLYTDLDLIRKNFDKRLSTETNIDITVNQFESSLTRLLEGFVILIDIDKTKKISMVNPSVNDYLDGFLKENLLEREMLIKNATHIQQIKRLMTNSEYEEWGQTVIKEHTINNIDFINKGQKNAIITYFISKYGILDTEYSDIINEFLLNPFNVIYRVHVDISVKDIIELLFNDEKTLEFYNIVSYLSLPNNLKTFYRHFDIEDLCDIINFLDSCFNKPYREEFIKSSIDSFKFAIESFCDDVDVDDYSPDVEYAIDLATSYTLYEKIVDNDDAESYIEDEVIELVKDKIYDMVKNLPADVIIDSNYVENLDINVYGAYNLVDSYIEDEDYNEEYKYYNNSSDNDDSEIDYMFNRKF